MSTLEIHQIPTRIDNYVYILRESSTGMAAVIDPAQVSAAYTARHRDPRSSLTRRRSARTRHSRWLPKVDPLYPVRHSLPRLIGHSA